MLKFSKPSRGIVIAAVTLVVVLSVGFAVSKANDEINTIIPAVIATETLDGAQAKALDFGFSGFNGKSGVEADSIAPWQGEYAIENTLVVDGEMGQNMISLSAENPGTASYKIYLPDGAIYDEGTREPYDSLDSRLYWTEDKTGIGVIAPFEPGEYIYEITVGWEKNDLKVTYGFKLIMTGKRNAYDEALGIVWNHNDNALSVSFRGTETLHDSEYAGVCYVFEVEIPNGIEQVAVSKEKQIYFTFKGGTWWAFTGALESPGARPVASMLPASLSPDGKVRLEFVPDTNSSNTINLNIVDTETEQTLITHRYPSDTQFAVCWRDDSEYAAVGYRNSAGSRIIIYPTNIGSAVFGKEIFSYEFALEYGQLDNANWDVQPIEFNGDSILLYSVEWTEGGSRHKSIITWDFKHGDITSETSPLFQD